MVAKYYNRLLPPEKQVYFYTIDELLAAEGHTDLVGRKVIPSWLGIKFFDE